MRQYVDGLVRVAGGGNEWTVTFGEGRDAYSLAYESEVTARGLAGALAAFGEAAARRLLPPPEDRRAAAEALREEVVSTLDRVLAEASTAPTIVRHDPAADVDAVRKAAERATAWATGYTVLLPSDAPGVRAAWHPSPSLGPLRRLLWLLGLSPAERAFVDAAASEAAGGKPGASYEGLMVFADWLEDQGRTTDAGVFRRLLPAEGEILALSHPKDGEPAARAACAAFVAEMERFGRTIHAVALPPGWSLESAGPIVEGKLREQLRAEEFAALMRENADLGDRADAATLRVEQELSLARAEAAELRWALGVARTGAAIREAVMAEREACAALAENWREMPEVQDRPEDTGCMAAYSEGMECGAPDGIAAEIRNRPPV